MMRRLTAFILILGPLQGFLSQEIRVFQMPKVHANPGSDVILPCTYNVFGAWEANIGSFKWYKNLGKTRVEVTDTKNFTGQISRAEASEFISNRDAHITIHNVDSSLSGDYFCQVIFQHGKEISGLGNGTHLYVTDVPQKLAVCVLVKVAGLLLIVLTGFVTYNCSQCSTVSGVSSVSQRGLRPEYGDYAVSAAGSSDKPSRC